MILASHLRPGMAIKFEGQDYKVLAAEYHPGQGKMTGQTHARLQNLATGTLWDHAFRPELKLEEIPVEKQMLEFLYADAGACCFMHPESFEQVEIPQEAVGRQFGLLQAGMRLGVQFVDGRPIAVLFPDVLEVKIADTAPPTRQQADSAFKTAKLDNGAEVMVPQFVKTGDVIRLDVQTMRYMDRAKVT